MSNLSQEQKTKVNNFLRSLNQRITNFIEEMIDESNPASGMNQNKNGGPRRVERQIDELDQLLDELQNPPPVPPQKPAREERREKHRRPEKKHHHDQRPQNNRDRSENNFQQPVAAVQNDELNKNGTGPGFVQSQPVEPSMPTTLPAATAPADSNIPSVQPDSVPQVNQTDLQETIPTPPTVTEPSPSSIEQSAPAETPLESTPSVPQASENPPPQSQPPQNANNYSQISSLLDRVSQQN